MNFRKYGLILGIVFLGAASPVTNITPLLVGSVTTAGTPVTLIAAGGGVVFNGCYVQNDPAATTNLVVDPVNPASYSSPSKTASFILPGGKWSCPGAMVNALTADAAENGHKIFGGMY